MNKIKLAKDCARDSLLYQWPVANMGTKVSCDDLLCHIR